MPWQDLMNQLGQKIQNNLQKNDDLTTATTGQMIDRMQMDDPNKQGPRLPDQTPQEQQYDKSIPGAMIGAVAPGAGSAMEALAARGMTKMAVPSAAELVAQKTANEAMQSGAAMPIAQRAQQALSRAADFADRARLQRFQSLKNKLGR